MFTTLIRIEKEFTAEQKIRELKTRVAKLNIKKQKLKISPKKIILKSAASLNNVTSEKYGLSPEEIEARLLSDEKFNFHIFHNFCYLIFIEQRKLDKCMKD